jgi:hypothetical protein
MNQVSDAVKKFFEDFEQASNGLDGELLALHFSDPFTAADPHGNIKVAKKEELVAGTSKRQAFFHSLGFQFVKIIPFDETRLDNRSVMVKVHVQMRFKKTSGQLIDIHNDSVHILFIKDDSLKIVFYLTHEDIMKVMQEYGLLPKKH